MTWTINLPRELDGFIENMVVGGRYGSASAVVADALGLLQDAMVANGASEQNFSDQIKEGLADIEAGRTVDIDQVFAEMDEIIRCHEEKRDAAE